MGGSEGAGVGGSHAKDADCIDIGGVEITGGAIRPAILITQSEDLLPLQSCASTYASQLLTLLKSVVHLQGLLHRPGGFHSRGVSPGDGGHSMESSSLVGGLHVDAHAPALRHAAGAPSELETCCPPRLHVVAFAHRSHVATLSPSLRAEAMQLEGMFVACFKAVCLDGRH